MVLVDLPADRGPAVDPGSHVDGLAWVVYRRVKGSASVGTMTVVVALELGQDGAQVPFTVDQQMVEALSAQRSHIPLRKGIRPRRPDWRFDNPYTVAGEHVVE